jgi:photosystem II stability/assembly factor-like uncharacterized protein
VKKIKISRRSLSSADSCALIVLMLTLALGSTIATGCTGSVSGNDAGDAGLDAQDAQTGDADAASGDDAGADSDPGPDAGSDPGPDAGSDSDGGPADNDPDPTVWDSRGVGGGGALYCPAINPHAGSEIFMATDMGAAFHSTDFGATWRTIDFRQLGGGSHSVIRFTSDPNVLYALGYSGDYLIPHKSTDGGATWQALAADPTGNEAFYLFVDPDRSDRLLVTDWNQLYYSGDGGASFASVHTCDGGTGCLAGGAFFDGDRVWVAMGDSLLQSDDGGQSFSVAQVGGIAADQVIVSFAGARQGQTVRFFAVTFNSADAWPGFTGGDLWGFAGIYSLDWGADNWTPTASLPADQRAVFVSMARTDISTAYLAGGNTDNGHPIVYKTSDGGLGWQSVLLTEGNQNVATGWAGSQGDTDWWFGEYALGFTVSPADPARVAITDLGFVHLTSDGGASWRQAYVNPADQNPAGANTPRSLAYRTSGVEQTSGWWLTWTSPDDIFGSWTDIRSIRSTDGGLFWRRERNNGLTLNTTYHALVHPDSGAVYAATSSVHDLYQSTYLADSRIDSGSGAVMISTDQAATFETLHDFGHPVVWLAQDPNDHESLYASVVHSQLGGLYVTRELSQGTQAGWARLAQPPRTEGHPYQVHVLNDGTLLISYSGRRDGDGAFTESSGIFSSTDSGLTWQDHSLPEMYRWTKDVIVDPHDATQSTWYAAVFSHWGHNPNEVGGLFRTKDRGQNWQRISDLYRVESATVDPADPNHMYVTTEAAGLWETNDLTSDNPSFVPVLEYPFAHPMRVQYDPHQPGQIWALSFGGGLRLMIE